MPGGDGRGASGGNGRGTGRIGSSMGRGKNNGPVAGGPGGRCVCPQCGTTAPHTVGAPCMSMKCPQCGAIMTRG